MGRLLCLVVVLLASCARPERHPPDLRADAGYAALVCDETTDLLTDINHCGACEAACPTADADQCVDGVCMCGSHETCIPGYDCRNGNCVPRDTSGRFCEFDSTCGAGFACIEGHCSRLECVPEICDGYDNDCDGIVDNSGATPLSGWCSGTEVAVPGSVMAPCTVGIRLCVEGAWGECLGDVPPVPEVGLLACDGADNDCDGCVDGVIESGVCVSQEPVGIDVLFLIDTSGSMTNKIHIVKQATNLFSTRLSTSSNIHYGIETVPGPVDGTPALYQDLTDFATFKAALQTLPHGGSGSEPQWDAVVEALDGTLSVSWTSGAAKIIILFTDEGGQTTRARRTSPVLPPVYEAEMCAAVVAAGVAFIPVVTAPYAGDFDDCAYRSVTLPSFGLYAGTGTACTEDADCDGSDTCEAAVCVSAAVIEMVNNLEVVIANPCG